MTVTSARNSNADAQYHLSVVGSLPLDVVGQRTLVKLAAATPADTQDPVDLALRRTAGINLPVSNFDPATPERPYSLVVIENITFGGKQQRVAVMRGELNAVLEASATKGSQRTLALRNGANMHALGHKCMGIAMANMDGDTTGEFHFQGVVGLGIGGTKVLKPDMTDGYVRIQVWSFALRCQHWINALLMIAMSATGYYIMNPYFGPAITQDTGYLMGYIRLIHFISGYAWIGLGLWRLSLTVFATQRHFHWRSLWPLNNKQDIKYFFGTLGYYLFLKKHGPHYVGHNPLQQLTYSGIYAICLIQMISGLALFGLYNQTSMFWVIISYPVHWVGIPFMRLLHALIMFVLWAFVVLHIYLAFRADAIEEHGGVSAMINGGVWMKRGTVPVDGPEIE